MGWMMRLAVGRLEVDWGKNNGFVDHSALFQAGDVAQIPYYSAGQEIKGADGAPDWEVITELKEGLSKPLVQVIERINLLGHTHSVCEAEFAALAEFNGFDASCVYRKLRVGRIDDAGRRPWRATRCVRFAEPGGRPAHRGPMTGAFSPYCNSEHTLAASNADASRRARRCGPRTHDGSFRSTARQTNSATARPLQWVCRGCPWLVVGA